MLNFLCDKPSFTSIQKYKFHTSVKYLNDMDSHTLLSLENDPLAFYILALTSLLVPPFSATILPK